MKNQNTSNWIAIIIIGVIVIVTVFSCTTSPGTAVESASDTPATSNSSNLSPDSSTTSKEPTPSSNSSNSSNSSHPTDSVYINNHYYKILTYPYSMPDYETSKSFVTMACSNLGGYLAVLDVGEESELVGEFIAKYQKEHPDEENFVCEWDN